MDKQIIILIINIIILFIPSFKMELIHRSLKRLHNRIPDLQFVDLLAEVLHLTLDPVDVVHVRLATRVVDAVGLPAFEQFVPSYEGFYRGLFVGIN